MITHKFLHLSDLHGFFWRGLNDYSGGIIVTGDLMDDGAAFEARTLIGKLDQWRKPGIYMVPGNHDYGLRGNMFNQDAVKRFDVISGITQGHKFAEKKIYVNAFDNTCYLIGLNSCSMTASLSDYAQGEFGEQQLTDLAILLDEKKNKKATLVIAFHHHPFWDSRFSKLRDAKKFLMIVKTFSAYYKNIILLFGHKHEAGYVNINGNIHAFAAPASRLAGEATELIISDGELNWQAKKVKFYG